MFSRFSASSGPTSLSSSPSTTITTPASRIIKRKQVSRACDRCRLNRIKCDDREPCNNCRARGAVCSNNRQDEMRTLPSANREIDRLKTVVRELETQLEASRIAIQAQPLSSAQSSNDRMPVPNEASDGPEQHRRQRCQLSKGGAWLPDPSNPNARYHSPSSSLLFTRRVQAQLADVLGCPVSDWSKSNRLSTVSHEPRSPSLFSFHCDDQTMDMTMSRQQEECYLALYWQSHHLQMPILDPHKFKAAYDDLWDQETARRRPCPLIDIVLALCIQCSATFTPQVTTEDASVAGTWWYQRSQANLAHEYELPRLQTIQASALSVVYLINATMFNAAHAVLSTTVSIAETLGLHQTGPMSPSISMQEERLLLWQTLYLLDDRVSHELGREYLVDSQDLPCNTAATFAANLSQDKYMNFETINLTDYHVLCVRLSTTLRSICDRLEGASSRPDNDKNAKDDHENPTANSERSALLLLQLTKETKQWMQSVPEQLHLARRGASPPFSTSRASLELDAYVPLWIQRQRVLLELFYHSHMMLLYRSFVLLPHTSTSMPVSAGHGVACMSHASAIASIIGQMLAESDDLNLLHAVFQMQWDAFMSLTAFCVAHPLCPHAVTARAAMQTSVATLRLLSTKHGLGAAAGTADTAQNGLDQVNSIAQMYRSGSARFSDAGEAGTSAANATDRRFPSQFAPPESSSVCLATPYHGSSPAVHHGGVLEPSINGEMSPSATIAPIQMSSLVQGSMSMHDPITLAGSYETWSDMVMDPA